MQITIPIKFSIGDKVYRLIGTDIYTDTVSRIEVGAFNVSKQDLTVKPSVRYVLDNATGKFYESDLHADPADIVKRLQAQVKEIKSKAA